MSLAPEILLQIFGHLFHRFHVDDSFLRAVNPYYDILSASLVCRAWLPCAREIMYSDLRIVTTGTPPHHRSTHLRCERLLECLETFGRNDAAFLSRIDRLYVFVGITPLLSGRQAEFTHIDWGILTAILALCPKITTLVTNMQTLRDPSARDPDCGRSHAFSASSFDEKSLNILRTSSVTHLEIVGSLEQCPDFIYQLISSLPNLSRLDLGGIDEIGNRFSWPVWMWRPLHLNVKHFSCGDGSVATFLLRAMARSPPTEFRAHCLERLARHYPNLPEILCNLSTLHVRLLQLECAELLSSCSNLQRLIVDEVAHLETEAIAKVPPSVISFGFFGSVPTSVPDAICHWWSPRFFAQHTDLKQIEVYHWSTLSLSAKFTKVDDPRRELNRAMTRLSQFVAGRLRIVSKHGVSARWFAGAPMTQVQWPLYAS